MQERLEKLAAAIRRGHRFATYDVWRIGLPGEEVPSGFIIKQIRVGILLISNLWRGTVMLRASALTFATILAIVPSLAIMFYVIQTLALDEAIFQASKTRVEQFVQRASEFVRPDSEAVDEETQTPSDLIEDAEGATIPAAEAERPSEETAETPPEPPGAAGPDATGSAVAAGASETDETLRRVIRRLLFPESDTSEREYVDPVQELFNMASKLADNATKDPSGLLIAGIVLFFTTVLGLMRNIEKSFNDIWGVRRTRSWFRMVGDYMLITMFLPFVAALVMGVTAALQTQSVQQELGPFAVLIRGSQYLIVWFMFTALYAVVPNTRVKFAYAALGGLVAAAIWVGMSWAFVRFQFGLTRYSVVYSTFAQFPMMLMWIYLSWTVLLFGAELTFAYQNEKTFAMERYAENASYAYRETLALRAMLDVAQRFDQGLPGFAPGPAANRFNVPTRLLNDIMEDLEQYGLVIKCATVPVTYQPARALSKITTGEIIRAMREVGRDPSLLRQDDDVKKLMSEVYGDGAHGGTTLAQLVERYPAPEDDPAERQTIPFDAGNRKFDSTSG